jgi:hypothetical protein
MNRRAFITAVSASAALPVVAVASAVGGTTESPPGSVAIEGKVYDLVYLHIVIPPCSPNPKGKVLWAIDRRDGGRGLTEQIFKIADTKGRFMITNKGEDYSGTITHVTYRARTGGIDDCTFPFDKVSAAGKPFSWRSSFSPVES